MILTLPCDIACIVATVDYGKGTLAIWLNGNNVETWTVPVVDPSKMVNQFVQDTDVRFSVANVADPATYPGHEMFGVISGLSLFGRVLSPDSIRDLYSLGPNDTGTCFGVSPIVWIAGGGVLLVAGGVLVVFGLPFDRRGRKRWQGIRVNFFLTRRRESKTSATSTKSTDSISRLMADSAMSSPVAATSSTTTPVSVLPSQSQPATSATATATSTSSSTSTPLASPTSASAWENTPSPKQSPRTPPLKTRDISV